MKTLLLCLAAAVLAAAPSRALELSLEENRAERGSVGFVDIQKVFAEFPETLKAKEEFEGEFSKRDQEIRARKNALTVLRTELARLESEREFLKQTPLLVSSAAATAAPHAPASSTATASGAVLTSTASAASGMISVSTATPSLSTTTMAGLPGISTASLVGLPGLPALTRTDPSVQAAEEAAAQAASARAAAQAADHLKALEALIVSKRKAAEEAQAGLRSYAGQAEKDLAEIERQKSRSLLSRIYVLVRQVAQEEGVSVVVDKSNILFGGDAVDLTQRLIDRLHAESKK